MAFVVRLEPEELAELERRRAAGGYRSANATIKAWLSAAIDVGVVAPGSALVDVPRTVFVQVAPTYAMSEVGDPTSFYAKPIKRPRATNRNKAIDHINGDPLDNRLENLKVVAKAATAQRRVVGFDPLSGDPIYEKAK